MNQNNTRGKLIAILATLAALLLLNQAIPVLAATRRLLLHSLNEPWSFNSRAPSISVGVDDQGRLIDALTGSTSDDGFSLSFDADPGSSLILLQVLILAPTPGGQCPAEDRCGLS